MYMNPLSLFLYLLLLSTEIDSKIEIYEGFQIFKDYQFFLQSLRQLTVLPVIQYRLI